MSSAALGQRPVLRNSAEISPELELLLACSAFAKAERRASRVRELLAGPVNGKQLVEVAERHGLMPQLYQRLSAFSSNLPAEMLLLLRSRFERNARQSLFLTQLLARVLDVFHRQGIEALVLKGPALAQMLYGDVALRQFSDIDLLIRPQAVAAAKQALNQLGFTAMELTPREEKAHIASGYEYAFDSAEHKSLIEVQWRILPRFYVVDFETERFFRKAETIEICERPCPTLSADDLLLVLCVHAAKHLWQKIAWISDIAQLAESRTINWGEVMKEAERLGIQRMVAITFFVAQKLLEHPAPSEVQEFWDRDRAGRALGIEILEAILGDREIDIESPEYFRLMLRLRERRSDRIRFLTRLALTPTITEWRAVRLPAALFPAYRAVRMGRLLGRAFRTGRRFDT